MLDIPFIIMTLNIPFEPRTCPRCGTEMKLSGKTRNEERNSGTYWGLREYVCPKCDQKFTAHYVTLYEELPLKEEFRTK